MKFYLCIDDTDDATKSIGTGQIASMIYDALQERGSRMRYQITRHQLLLDPRIDYTSHNSSMCMEGETMLRADEIWELASEYLLRERAETSDPGICLYVPPEIPDEKRLCEFGRKAKEQVFTVNDAAEIARKTPGIQLGAPVGNGNGQIGALAGVGLRLGGNDGTFRGKIAFNGKVVCTAKEMKQKLEIAGLYGLKGEVIPDNASVVISGSVKLVYRNFQAVAVGRPMVDGTYELCSKASVLEADTGLSRSQIQDCEHFAWDNDSGEQWSSTKGTCENCLYRRLTRKGMKCRYYNRMLPTSVEELERVFR